MDNCSEGDGAHGAFIHAPGRHRILDLTMGLGSLLFGHGHPQIVQAVTSQAYAGWWRSADSFDQATVHSWTAMIEKLIPSADKVQPTASATEANQLAIRLARSVTRRELIIRFQGHYHGIFDEALTAGASDEVESGLHPLAGTRVLVLDEEDTDTVGDYLETGRVAAVILEPGEAVAAPCPSTRNGSGVCAKPRKRQGRLSSSMRPLPDSGTAPAECSRNST